MIPVIFRKDRQRNGAVFALFPAMAADINGFYCGCYQHVGQHGAANYVLCISNSRPATPAEYADLQDELVDIGYDDLAIYARATPQMKRERLAEHA